MANELKLGCSFSYVPSAGPTRKLDKVFNASPSTVRKIENERVLSTSEEALDLGEITSLGWSYFENLSTDTTEIIHIRVSSGGTIFAQLGAGEACMIPFSSGVTAPYVKSAAGTPKLFYIITSR